MTAFDKLYDKNLANSDPSGLLPDGVVCPGSSSSSSGGGSSSSNSGLGTFTSASTSTSTDNNDDTAASWFQEVYECVTNYFGWE